MSPQSSLALANHMRTQWEVCNSEKDPHQTLHSDLRCPASRIESNKFLLFLSSKQDKWKTKKKTETDSQTQKTNAWLSKGKEAGRNKLGVWD